MSDGNKMYVLRFINIAYTLNLFQSVRCSFALFFIHSIKALRISIAIFVQFNMLNRQCFLTRLHGTFWRKLNVFYALGASNLTHL